MKKVFMFFVIVIIMSAGSAFALPSSFFDNFPSEDATVIGSVGAIDADEFGYFWSVSRGDSITETFSGTSLEYANQLDLTFDVTRNVLNSGAVVNWDVLVNGTAVGAWSWGDNSGTGTVGLSYSFADIYGYDTYEIAMVVTNQVPGGFGSIAIGYPGDMIIYGDTGTAPVPEPSTILLMGVGLFGLVGYNRKRFSKKS